MSASKPATSSRLESGFVHHSYGALHWFSSLNQVRQIRAQARIPLIAVLCLHQQSPALEIKVRDQYLDNHTSGACQSELFEFSPLWRPVGDLTVSTASGCGHSALSKYHHLSGFVFHQNLSSVSDISTLALHSCSQLFTFRYSYSVQLSQVRSTDCLCLLSSP